ncbi:MAG: hypothetical protein QOE89_2980, partial [Pseudonocardiales bacterium]|nr:hypothetical protein [Pseudonocardiales bacterium]
MTTTAPTPTPPRTPQLSRPVAMRLAATEYQRVIDLLSSLPPADWSKPTDCPNWDVRAMATHLLGMAEMAASIREQSRQVKAATKRGGVFLDALTGLQVEQRTHLTPDQITARLKKVAPKAVRGRRLAPGMVRRRTMRQPQLVGGREETWTIGFLLDVILTRDPWMHRIDITRATGAAHLLTAEHDGVLIADIVIEWAERHGQPFSLNLTGPAGGRWTVGTGGPQLELDVVDFCRALSGRAHP